MRKLWTFLAICLALGVSAAIGRLVQGEEAKATRAIPITPSTVGVRIMFGLQDTQPTSWDGSLTVSSGSVIRLEGWRFRQGDAVLGTGGWRASTRRQQPRAGQQQQRQAARQAGGGQAAVRAARQAARRAANQAAAAGAAPGQAAAPAAGAARAPAAGAAAAADLPMAPNGVIVVLNAEPRAEVRVTTPRGEFRFNPWELPAGQTVAFLNGAASAERVPPSFQLTTSQQTEDDFPAAAVDRDGTLWVSYVAYRYGQPEHPHLTPMQEEPRDFGFLQPKGNGDQVRLARLTATSTGSTWSEAAAVTEPGQDVSRPAVAVAADGTVWVVWSQNARGNWDLYARRFRNGALGNPVRVTSDGGPDLNPALASDEQGNVWLAWQGFRNGSSDIFLTSAARDGERWSEPMRISSGPRNDWDPQVACGPDGAVHVVWDTYDQGNYDVMMRRLAGGKLSDPVAVANTTRFEARPSLVCDARNRVWVAWEEAPEKWGKDFGFGVQDQGTPLYRGHTVGLRCFQDGKPYRTAGALSLRVAQGPAQQNSFPRLGQDRQGRVFLTFRHPIPDLRGGVGTAWFSYVTTYEGNSWSTPILIPDTDALLDNRPAILAGTGNGPVYMVYSSDGRSHAFDRPARYEVFVAPIAWDRAGAAAPALVAEEARPTPPMTPDATAEAADVARIRAFRARVGGKSYQLLRGDYHRHTEISGDGGGDGALIDMFRYAMDAAGQDWMCAGDHDNGGGREYTWWQIQKLDDAFHVGPQFVPIFGYERSVRYPDGHRNVMFVQRGIRPLPRLAGTQPNNVSTNDTKMLYKYLRVFDGICSSHTSATDMGTDWRDNDPKVEPIVEIYQGDRQNYEYQGAPRSGTQGNSPGGFQPAGFVWNAFAKGYRLGFQASSDHVSTHISYATVFAERPTREAVLDAFKKRHSYGATDNIILDVRSGDHMMGDEFQTRQPPKLEIHAIGTRPIAQVVIVKDNKVVYTATPGKAEVNLSWSDNQPHPGVSYYYVRVEQEDGQLAWASPMWIEYFRTGA